MLQINNLQARVEDKAILKGISLNVKPGEIHAIMGPNGSGKSTLSHVLAGRPGYEVTGGSVSYKGKDLLDMKPGQVKTVESAKQYQVTINIEASLKKLTEFMYAVETSKQLLKIEKFQISVKSKEDATVKSTMTISRIILLSPE